MRPALTALALLLAAPVAAAESHLPTANPAKPARPAPAAAPAPGAVAGSIVLFPALGRPTQLTVTGRVLSAATPGVGPWGRGLAGATVEVSLGSQVRRVLSGADGLFEVTFASPADRPLPAGAGAARALCGAASAEGQVQVVEDGAPFLVIIDADDQVGLAARRGEPGEEAPPANLAAFLRCLVEGTRPAVGAVALATGGERAARLQAALAKDGFPPVGLLAVPASARGAGQEATLRSLLSTFPQPVLLLGDAGGRAPERFRALTAEFPGRVAAVYVRGSATGAGAARFDGMTLFTDPLTAARHAAARGLADQACVERALQPPVPAEPPAPASAAGAGEPAAASPPACPPCPCAAPPADDRAASPPAAGR